jgi:putative transposase
MDGKGCWRDNVFVERLWKSVNHDEVYLHAYDSVPEAYQGLQRHFSFYNQRRLHSSLDGRTPIYGLLRRAATVSGSLMLTRQSFT